MYKAGVSYAEFGKLNMNQMRYISNAYAEKVKEDMRIADVSAFIQGRYMVDALLCTVGNMFGKNSDFKYPEEAYTAKHDKEVQEVGGEDELVEAQKRAQRDLIFANLKVMELNNKILKEKQALEAKQAQTQE